MTLQRTPDFGWAIIGPGGIAQVFADAVGQIDRAHVAAVWGRDPHQAGGFAARLGGQPPRVHARLDDLLEDPAVNAVYIATTHDAHMAFASRCLRAGKPVLCEKPLTPSLAASRQLVALAHRHRVFLMEGLWTRFLPVYAEVERWLCSGAIGAVRSVHSSFCFATPYHPTSRLFDPQRAGGALLDIGIYNFAMTRWALSRADGACPAIVSRDLLHSMAPSQVELCVSGQYRFEGGADAQFVCGFDRVGDNALRIFGTAGAIVLPDRFWQAEQAELHRPGVPPVNVVRCHRVNGFEYEIEEAMRCVRSGLLESPLMPHAESLALAAWLDDARQAIGMPAAVYV